MRSEGKVEISASVVCGHNLWYSEKKNVLPANFEPLGL